MSLWLFLSILTPILWAFCNVFDGAIRRKYVKNDMATTWFLGITRIPFIILFLALSKGALPDFSTLAFMLLAGFLWIAPFILYYRAIGFEEPSRVVLIIQMIPVFTLLISFFLIQERLAVNQIIAFTLLLLGGILSAIKKLEGSWRFSAAFWLMTLASLFWAFSDVLFKKFEMQFNHFFPAIAFYFAGGALFSILILLFKKSRSSIIANFSHLPRRAWILYLINQTLGIAGTVAFAYALTLGKASLTVVFLGIQPLFVFLLGILLSRVLHEIIPETNNRPSLIFKGISFIFIIAGLALLNI